MAIKLIKTGLNSRAMLARFEQERPALAMMDHPNIACVLDRGLTSTGHPFFVKELVNGLSLTRFCNEAKLSLGRLQLSSFGPGRRRSRPASRHQIGEVAHPVRIL